jgi:hypothetical protein
VATLLVAFGPLLGATTNGVGLLIPVLAEGVFLLCVGSLVAFSHRRPCAVKEEIKEEQTLSKRFDGAGINIRDQILPKFVYLL